MPPSTPPTPAASGGRKRRPLVLVLGLLVLVGGLGAAVVLALGGSKQLEDGVKDLARGPANCVTTLEVERDATYYFYVESTGVLGDTRGDCPSLGDSYDVGDAGEPALSLTDADGEAVRLRRADGISYDTGGYSGELVNTARLEEGRYQLAVTADDDVVIAVGLDVDTLEPNVILPIVVGAAGLLLGIALLLLSRGGRRSTPTAPGPMASSSGPPAAGAPTAWVPQPAPQPGPPPPPTTR